MSLGNKDFIVPEEPLEQERFKLWLIATSRTLKKKQQQLQADQDLLNDRWTNVLAAEEYGLEHPTKSYLKRKLLPQFDDKALEPVLPARNAADQPPRGWDKAATQAEHQPAIPRYRNRDTTARGYTYDLWHDLENRAGQNRSIYGSGGRAPMRDDGHKAERDKYNHVWGENRRRTPSELRHDLARYTGAATPPLLH